MECRLRATPEQFMILLKFMESHGDLGKPHPGLQARIKYERLWHQLGKMLNSSAGGVVKALEKWKKVWADWKTKTKKKALRIRREFPNGGAGTRLTLTGPEKRVLAVMGFKHNVGLKVIKIEKEAYDEEPIKGPPLSHLMEPIKRDPLSPTDTDPNQAEFSSYSVKEEVLLNFIPIHYMEQSSIATLPPPSEHSPRVPTPPPARVPTPAPARVPTPAPPLNASTSQGMTRRWRRVTRLPEASEATALRRQRLLRARTQKEQAFYQKYANEFASVELARLQLEAEREKNNHQKEMERLKLESRRIEMEENRNETLIRLVGVLDKLTEVLPQLRPSSLPSPITLPLENHST